MQNLSLTVHDDGQAQLLEVTVENLVIAGWAGRNKVAVEHHIAELEALGVPRPSSTPIFYRVSSQRLTTSSILEDVGETSSGEIETFFLAKGGQLFIGVGSDHTDRKVEAYNITVSKQMCDKPIAEEVWPFEQVADHWDALILRSFVTIGGKRSLYQEGEVSSLLAPGVLISEYAKAQKLPDGTLMFGGTLPVIGGIRPGASFEGQLEDPLLKRKISFSYNIKNLPINI